LGIHKFIRVKTKKYLLKISKKLKLSIRDNPGVDIKGANLYREHLMGSSNGDRGHRHQHMTSVNEQNSVVESILVCTGVYNAQNDLRFHVRKLLKEDEVAF
jgi:hypothetical protein